MRTVSLRSTASGNLTIDKQGKTPGIHGASGRGSNGTIYYAVANVPNVVPDSHVLRVFSEVAAMRANFGADRSDPESWTYDYAELAPGKIIRNPTAEEFRAWYERRGWTQAQAAESLGVTQPRIAEMATDRSPVRPQIARLMAALDRIDELEGKGYD